MRLFSGLTALCAAALFTSQALAAPLILAGSALRQLEHGWRYAGVTALGLLAAVL